MCGKDRQIVWRNEMLGSLIDNGWLEEIDFRIGGVRAAGGGVAASAPQAWVNDGDTNTMERGLLSPRGRVRRFASTLSQGS